MIWIIIIVILLIMLSPDKDEATANVLAFVFEIIITVVLFGVNPLLGIIVGYLFLKGWDS